MRPYVFVNCFLKKKTLLAQLCHRAPYWSEYSIGHHFPDFFQKTNQEKSYKNFSFKILKIPQDFDSPFFDFSHLCYQLCAVGVLDF